MSQYGEVALLAPSLLCLGAVIRFMEQEEWSLNARARCTRTPTCDNGCFVVGKERCAGERAPVILIEMQRFTRTKAFVEVKDSTVSDHVLGRGLVSACYVTGGQFVSYRTEPFYHYFQDSDSRKRAFRGESRKFTMWG